MEQEKTSESEDEEFAESDTEEEVDMVLESDTENEEEEIHEKKEKKNAEDERWIISGHVSCLNKNSQDGGFNFIVKDILCPKNKKAKRKIPKIFQIRRISALPSYCPWILYELVVEKPTENQGCIHIITEIISCKYREIKKIDIKKYIVDQRAMTEDDEKLFQERVKKAFRKVPKAIRCKADMKENMRDTFLMEVALEILAPCFRCGSILSLLPYFPYAFISWMNEQQSTALLAMVYHVPHVFCFWDKFVSIAISLMGVKSPIFLKKRDNLELDQGYIYKMKERLNDTTRELVYDARNPSWSIKCLEKAISDFKYIKYDKDSIEIIEIAMRIYIAFHEEKNSFKNSIYDVVKLYDTTKREDTEMIMKVDRAIQFLSENKILCSKADLNDFLGKECIAQMQAKLERLGGERTFFLLNDSKYVVMDINICIQELEMAALITEKEPELRLFVCNDYAEEYLSVLRSIINGRMMSEETLARTVWLSPNKVCAKFMSKYTGFEFKVISSYVREIKKTKKKKMVGTTRAIVFDRFQKYSILEIVEILRICPPKCILYIFGDTNDYGPNSKNGTHHLMSEFCGLFKYEPMMSDGVSDMSKLRYELHNGNIGGLDVKKLEKNKDLHEVICEIEEKIYGKKKKKRHSTVHRTAVNEMNNESYHIFCTNESDKDTVQTLFLEKKNRLYIKGEFMLWDKVTIANDGNMGRLEKIWKSDIHGNKSYQIVDTKKKVNIFRSPHIFRLFGDTEDYNTSKVSVVHSDVDVLSKFSGAPANYVIIVAGKNTSYTDVEIASKYARKELKLLLLPEASIHKLYSYKKDIFNNQYKSDLKYKLSFFMK